MPDNIQHGAEPSDRAKRLARARLSLEGLSVGDAFGQASFGFGANIEFALQQRQSPPAPWPYTDDTVMALSIVEELTARGRIDQDELAERFAAAFLVEPDRGYGQTAMRILWEIARGLDWREVSRGAFAGQGSMGNGSAMRVGPVGAFYADAPRETVRQATAAAEVTHMHPEGIAGAIATAAAAGAAWRAGATGEPARRGAILEAAIDLTPPGAVRSGLEAAARLPADTTAEQAAARLGNGSRITCPDTVPFCVWCADRYLDSYEEAIWSAVSALGDSDTNCAIVGSIVVMATGLDAIPRPWLAARESLPALG
ncbi:MAG: ADP-ribosyl-(dinitrogen reductase) glycohydrolase [Planctomycetes bacterium ADurb.Bin126]|nr:MAG: ADP-ribosyl-(dinitrogen reductase) glycohydrolase [Planctomycetes bacterium ADurb.Bin126]HOD81731.1 ADP-ribosylglycohydrolase family protein [Phycisphaerae bacterium]